jgi:hypothetical protein
MDNPRCYLFQLKVEALCPQVLRFYLQPPLVAQDLVVMVAAAVVEVECSQCPMEVECLHLLPLAMYEVNPILLFSRFGSTHHHEPSEKDLLHL